MNKYFDIHTHTNMQPLESDFSQIADKCKQLKISYVDVGSNLDNSLVAIEHANKKNNVYACIGIHPEDTKNIDITLAIKNLEDMLIKNSKKRVVAIGETGLDYHYQNYDKKVQTDSFLAHINLAKKYHLSLMVHVRDAYDDCLKILKEYAKDLKVIIHCFTPTIKIAKEYIKEKNL
jgi:TatD DNase family protein